MTKPTHNSPSGLHLNEQRVQAMTKIKYLVNGYQSLYAAAKHFNVSPTQLARWVSYNCLVDDDGTIYKPQGSITVKDGRVKK